VSPTLGKAPKLSQGGVALANTCIGIVKNRMLILPGATAHSPFPPVTPPREPWRGRRRHTGPGVAVRHLAVVDGSLEPHARALLDRLLEYGPTRAVVPAGLDEFFLEVGREGNQLLPDTPVTVEPWDIEKMVAVAPKYGIEIVLPEIK
jgi:hypothetical protein